MKSTKKPNPTFPELDVVNLKLSLQDMLKSNKLDENPRKNAISKVREAYDKARLSLKSIIFKHPELSQKTLSAYTKITDDVIVNDVQGDLVADKLLFDIKSQTLKIETFNENKISVNVDTDEKRF